MNYAKFYDEKKYIVDRQARIIGDVEIGENSRIDANAVITGPTKIGRNVHIGAGCFVSGGAGVELHDFSSLSPGVMVFGASDDYSGYSMTNPTVPMECKPGLVEKSVLIGRHSIIGAGSVILPGVHIGEGVAVGAMSLVKSDLEPWGIYAGQPAKRIRARSMGLLKYESLVHD